MSGSSRKRPYSLDLDDDGNQDATNGTSSSGSSSNSERKSRIDTPAKKQMTLFSFGFNFGQPRNTKLRFPSPPGSLKHAPVAPEYVDLVAEVDAQAAVIKQQQQQSISSEQQQQSDSLKQQQQSDSPKQQPQSISPKQQQQLISPKQQQLSASPRQIQQLKLPFRHHGRSPPKIRLLKSSPKTPPVPSRSEPSNQHFSPRFPASLERLLERSQQSISSEQQQQSDSLKQQQQSDSPKQQPQSISPKQQQQLISPKQQQLSASPRQIQQLRLPFRHHGRSPPKIRLLKSSPTTPPVPSRSEPSNQHFSPRFPASLERLLNRSQPAANLDDNTTSSDKQGVGNYAHLKYDFLQPLLRRDIYMRTPSHPDYDEKTLYVPERFLKDQTPAMRQWWSIKQKNMDAVLFFKMGKFYELFNEDAVIGVNELDLNFMKVSDDSKPAHAGFPESSFQKYSKKLIEKGYKVMRIEQTETPAMLEERVQVSGVKCSDRVVKREICQVTTKGTQMLGISDLVFHSAQNQYLLALFETTDDQQTISPKAPKLFGVCFLDVTIGKLYLGQFNDDHNLSNLNILLAHHTPAEIIYERNNLTSDTYKTLLRTGARIVALRPVSEFWPLRRALSHLKGHRIFSGPSGDFEWPKELSCLFEEGDVSDEILSLEPRDEHKFALNSFGAIVYYLQSQLIAKQVLACGNIEIYTSPLDHPNGATGRSTSSSKPPMVMDHVALKNLEIFMDSQGRTSPTLFSCLNNCQTHFGQRLLKNWLCSPLCDLVGIKSRQDAIETLMSNNSASLMNEIVFMLKSTPDLERMLSKIKNHCFKSESDTRAIMFDGNQYNKAKVTAFVNLLSNFRRIRKFIDSVTKSAQNCNSHVLRQLMSTTSNNGLYPEYEETLNYFENAFDHKKALQTGQIIPAKGINAEYDKCEQNIEEMKKLLDEYLEDRRCELNCREVEYFGTSKNRYQLQVPTSIEKRVPWHWTIQSGRKGFKRYYTAFIDKHFGKLTTYEEEMKRILDGILADIFAHFLRDAKLWSAAIECVATLDVLQSMAKFARSLMARGVELCRPKLIENSDEPVVEYTEGRHPVLVSLDANFIPNDLKLDSKLLMLSGANMGGKSTIMRQTALLVILAQLGCYVPASSMSLVPVDRIFSRLGASDKLIEGESTFYTELVETSAMLRCATKKSLLLLDELGRGTSTFDGTAIAYSVLKEISSNMKCRCIFSTHYHTLTRDFMNSNQVRLAHMACKVERENDGTDIDLDPLKENITFLYKIADGPAARSYGFNVAKLAGIQDKIITEAFEKSKQIELECKVLAAMQTVCRFHNLSGKSEALKSRVLALVAN